MNCWRVAAIAALAGLAACEDPVVPRSGTPTLDDPGVGSVALASVGKEHTCAVLTNGDAYCWGSNEYGQLGAGASSSQCTKIDRKIPCEPWPQLVAGGLKWQKIAAGATHTCGIATNGWVYCWGDNAYGQLGDPAQVQTDTPVGILSAALFADLAAGDGHTCGLRTDGAAVCWGANDYGQLGVAASGTGTAVPTLVQSNLRWASITAGAKRTCARQADGSPYCWGAQWVSRGSDGSELNRSQSQPLRMLSSPLFRMLSVGGMTTCGLAADGTASCWEANPTGTIGDGTTAGATTPQVVKTALKFSTISVGGSSVCGTTIDGAGYCWGASGSGQLGIAPSTVSGRCGAMPCVLTPTRTNGWRQYSAAFAGLGDHACALTLTGNLYCWGEGGLGQRGDGRVGTLWSATRVGLP